MAKCTYRVAFYRGTEFLGVIASRLGRLTVDDAGLLAARYNAAYPYSNGTFWPVEMTDSGCILRPPYMTTERAA